MKSLINRIILFFLWIWTGIANVSAQSPTHIDTRQREPTPFSLDDILLYIVAPLVILLLSLWYRYRQNKKRLAEENEDKTSDR